MAKHHRRRDHHARRNRPRVNARRHRRSRRNYVVPGFIANPHRRRSRPRRNPLLSGRTRRRIRRYFRGRRNPAVMGFELPPMEMTLAAAAGFMLPAVLESYITPMLPASITQTSWGPWLVRGGIVVGLGMLARKFDRRVGTAVLVGGGVYILAKALAAFAPGLIPGLSDYTLGYYPPMRFQRTTPRPALSAYGGSSLLNTAGRLSPAARYGGA